MSRPWRVWILRAVQVAWFRRTRSLLATWVLACSFVLGMATPSRAENVRPREVRVCVRPPGVPANLDRWVHSPGGKVLTERWALMVYKNRPITVYVFDPKAPAISATYLPPGLFGSLKCPAKVAPKKLEPKAPQKKSEDGPHKKTKKEAQEREAAKPEPKELTAKEREAKPERERREKQAREDELHRFRERERPKVLPRDGVTAAWPSKVLPEQKREGVMSAWPSKVMPTARVLPTAGSMPRTALCAAPGAPAPKLAGGKDGAAAMAVREPILKELLGYKKAKSEAEKDAHRRKLRELFESIGDSAAHPFQVMLSTQNALAVTFREVLRGDPFRDELFGILEKKYIPGPAQCSPAAPSPAPLSGVTLPAVTLTDEGAFDELHSLLQQRITAIREGCDRIGRFNLKDAKGQLLKLVAVLSHLLTRAQRTKASAFNETDATKKVEGLKKAGAAYAGVLVVSQLWQLYVNIALVTDSADAMGVPSSLRDAPEDNPLAKRLLEFEKDNAIVALTQAGLDADAPAMVATLPAGSQAYERHVTSLDRWMASIQRGAVLSKKVIQVADIALIAISIYQVAKMPVVPAGGSPTPPTILGTLPGGAAVGLVVSLPSLARALEAIRRLVAIGALDGALVAGVGSLGGGPGIALPELQRPTSLSVQSGQGTGGPGGGGGPPKPSSGQPDASGPAADYAGVKGRVSTLPPGKSPNVYQVNTPEEMANLFNELSQGGRNVTPPTYKGTMVELPDGTLVGMRMGSKSGGPTIDVRPPKGSDLNPLKVHLP